MKYIFLLVADNGAIFRIIRCNAPSDIKDDVKRLAINYSNSYIISGENEIQIDTLYSKLINTYDRDFKSGSVCVGGNSKYLDYNQLESVIQTIAVDMEDNNWQTHNMKFVMGIGNDIFTNDMNVKDGYINGLPIFMRFVHFNRKNDLSIIFDNSGEILVSLSLPIDTKTFDTFRPPELVYVENTNRFVLNTTASVRKQGSKNNINFSVNLSAVNSITKRKVIKNKIARAAIRNEVVYIVR